VLCKIVWKSILRYLAEDSSKKYLQDNKIIHFSTVCKTEDSVLKIVFEDTRDTRHVQSIDAMCTALMLCEVKFIDDRRVNGS
jgi:hypothetical protein